VSLLSLSKRKLDETEARDPARVREAALRLLARREHSEQELTAKLADRGYTPEAVATVTAALKDKRLLSDERFVEEFVAARTRRGSGPLKIREELRGRGIAPELVDQALGARKQEWAAGAEAARRKRFGAAPPKDFQERARQARFLQQRGFSLEDIRAALKGDPED
jgi:regulatory protein